MSIGLSRFRMVIVGALVLIGGAAFAATYYGTVEEVSVDDNSVSVKTIGKQGTTKKFTVGPKTQILVEGKKVELTAVEAGQNATILTDTANNVTRLSLKNAKGKTAASTGTSKSPRTSDSTSTATTATEGEWPQHRGANRDNISTEKGLLDKWPADGPKLAWRQTGLGEGYSSVAIANGKLFTMGNRGSDEMLLAFDVSDGKPLWATKTGRAYREGQGNGPRGTPTVDKDRVYALGANGDLACVGEEKGEIVWQQNILDEYGGSNIQWGISESVLIDGNNLICSPGGRQGTIVALNKLTGRPVWRSNIQGSPSAAYSSPIAVDFGGVRQYVNFVHTGVVSVSAKDGSPLWGFRESSNGTANCSTPLYADGTVYTSSGYSTGAAAFRLAPGGKATLAYSNKEMVNHHGGMVLLDGHVYGFDENVLKCVDLKTGRAAWQSRSVGKGSLTYADGHLYLRGERGPVALAVATTNGYEEKGQFDPPTRSGKPSWSHPVVCAGKLFLRDMDTLLAYDVKK